MNPADYYALPRSPQIREGYRYLPADVRTDNAKPGDDVLYVRVVSIDKLRSYGLPPTIKLIELVHVTLEEYTDDYEDVTV